MSAARNITSLAAGGTGGHLIPAFALAAELHQRGHHVALITDERGAAIPGKPDFLTAHVLPAGRFGKNPLKWPGGIKAVLEGRGMALRLFESFAPIRRGRLRRLSGAARAAAPRPRPKSPA